MTCFFFFSSSFVTVIIVDSFVISQEILIPLNILSFIHASGRLIGNCFFPFLPQSLLLFNDTYTHLLKKTERKEQILLSLFF